MPRKKISKSAKANTINRKDLIDALTKVKPGLSQKELIEQSSHFIFEENRIWTYNDQITISQEFESHLIGAIKADEFYKLLNKLEDENLEISVQEGEFSIQGKTVMAKIKIDPEIKLQPIQTPGINSKNWQALPKDFTEAISLCLFSASRNMIRPELTCLFITGKTVLSTDSFRATKREMKSKIKTDFLIPAISAKELVKYNVHKVFVDNKGWLHFTNKEKTTFSCRTFADVKYPEKVWDFFDIEGEKINLPDPFESVIDRVSTLITEDFDLDRMVNLVIKDNKLICTGKGPYGSVSENINIDYNGKAIEVKVHPGFLMEILKSLNSMIIGERLLFQGENFEHVICLSE
jgi:DNA polymerase III sliding clamp (beta) subunit (PCNA family)